MPDLTIEYYWMCAEWHEWCTTSPKFHKMIGMKEPKCHWNQYTNNGEPKDGKCPCCGGELVSVPHGV